MQRSVPRLFRILSLALAVSLTLGTPAAWTQEEEKDEAKPPEGAQPAPQAPPDVPTQTAPEKAPAPEEAPAAPAPAPATKGATLKGRVLGADRKTPLPAAVVHAVASDGSVVSSAPASAKGNYLLSGLAPGTYLLAVSVEGGVYSLESPVGVSSAQTFTVDLATVPAEAAVASGSAVEGTPRGFCYIVQGKKDAGGTTFWRSPKGITLLAVTAGAVGLILASSGGSTEEEPVSPSAP